MRAAVIGAGLAGLAAARRLAEAGAAVTVFEKSRGLGGRLATRRVGDLVVNHGAPAIDAPVGTALRDLLEDLVPDARPVPGYGGAQAPAGAPLEPYGFSDFQQWGEMFGAPLQGAMLNGTVAFETVDWLRNKRPADQPWLLVSAMVNPHDIMFLETEDHVPPHDNGAMRGLLTKAQTLGFMKDFDVDLPENFDDDLSQQPYGVRAYKQGIEWNYGRVPDGREDMWKDRRRYLINCMRMVDMEFGKVLDEMDRQDLWDSTVVLFTSDHGEMNGAHHMTQKGSIHFDEAAVVNMTAVLPGADGGVRTDSVGSLLDIAPTCLELAGLSADEIRRRYSDVTGRSMLPTFTRPAEPGPRGSTRRRGTGRSPRGTASTCWTPTGP